MSAQGKLMYLGHGSFRIEASNGFVIFIDPFAGTGYDVPADLILVTHAHADHSTTDLVRQKPGCTVITYKEALQNGEYKRFSVGNVEIKAVPAYNAKHAKESCVGYVISVDNSKVYIAGDTSKIPEMSDLAEENITYAFLPIDGVYNMGPEEAGECAAMIKAKYTVPVHSCPSTQGIYDEENVRRFKAENKLIVKPNETVGL